MADFASFLNANSICAGKGPGSNNFTNTGLGYQTLAVNTSGYHNTAVGFQALRCNTSGFRNTAVGHCALRSNTTGCCNTAIGAFALVNNTSGGNHTAIGYRALVNVNTGQSNTGIGAYAGQAVTTGTSNVFVGFKAGCSTTTACWNVAVGDCALMSANSNENVAVGRFSLCSVTSGACNIGIGYRAGYQVATANCTITVGQNSSARNITGHTAWGNASMNYNGVRFGWTNVSDNRDKANIEDLDEKLGLDFIRSLDTVSFNWDNRQAYVSRCGYEYGTKDGTLASPKKSYGFIAQQMKEVLQNLNVKFDGLGHNDESDSYRLIYEEMIAPLIKATQQTTARLETLEALAG
jgi:hypothetical protein